MMETLEDVWREESSHVLSALLRRHGDLGDCEDAAQEALAAATVQWPRDGVPENPRGWLIRVASRRLIDRLRSEQARTAREEAMGAAQPADAFVSPPADHPSRDQDDGLQLLLLCCHPSLTRPSQVALTLRSVSGLTTAEIAAAFLVPERTMAQRLSRARGTLAASGARFRLPGEDTLPERVAALLDVLHLIFNEGYTRTAGEVLFDTSLTREAIRLTRQLQQELPDHDEVAGALALMLLTQSRHAARSNERGDLIPLAEQDRGLWDRSLIFEGVAILERVLPRGHVGRFQLQAAIAAVHAEAATWEDTDWPQITMLYDMLERIAPSPAVTLNRAVAVAMSLGPDHGLAVLDPLLEDSTMQRHHRTHAVRAHLLEMLGQRAAAADGYQRAAQLTTSLPEQRYLHAQALRLATAQPPTTDGPS